MNRLQNWFCACSVLVLPVRWFVLGSAQFVLWVYFIACASWLFLFFSYFNSMLKGCECVGQFEAFSEITFQKVRVGGCR